MKARALLLASSMLLSASAAAAAPEVVVSIKPIHSLAASIMKGVGEPKLIVEGAASPHTFTMKPSNARAVEGADMVFWMGPGMEAFLKKPLEALASDATVVELDDAEGLTKLPFREAGAFEAHEHDDEGHGHDHEETAEDDPGHDDHAGGPAEDHHHDHGEFDTHLWLDPMNAKAMAAAIEKALAEADPENAEAYAANLVSLNGRIDALDKEIAETIAPVKDKPLVVFHDAYQYFENHYGVRVVGSVTVSPEVMPGAERVQEIRRKVQELDAACVFAEPQFEPKLIQVVTEGTDARSGTLDPEGATLTEGSDLYFDLMRSIATNLKACLSGA
ncbi:High-affinity zinc uptake system protein znuA [Pseudorhizobium banfieldiae]|uniref:High-affinity zinc uptake system protein ZnuA n=1 Tax=Pseudorhizobium banfieldiae TaxID=1125847 RepID=L0NHB5_9HYPH|nr:zinc ABC transporter substrate-binding protein ZnuA [Pseudorhizobium banfieldiae]CAD6610653.1 zinc ABC transporter substrate-binding protein [arsenite-oxidising bacterium NT-25]CCF19677.1 High-affinity zinc uptake system protein znuA [Pseudorhizobium banfieldiae]